MAPTASKALPGALYERAAQFALDLDAGQTAAADQMLASWASAYGRVRVEIDTLLAKIEAAKAAGQPLSPAWLYQKDRLKAVLDTSKVQMARYAEHASAVAIAQQQAAVGAALKHAEKLTKAAVAESLDPALGASFVQPNEANLRTLAGHLADGSPLHTLTQSFPAETSTALRAALVQGVTLGKGTDWMVRQATSALGIARWRAETIMRTEALRAYRETVRQTYLANSHLVSGWIWHAHLDARTCACCVVMDGTEHPVDATLDGHPRCRCAMVPRTPTWEELGAGPGLPDTRPPVRSGKAWLEGQPGHVQRAILGRRKYEAWQAGEITLDDVVARTSSPQWGTMRRERSLAEIKAGANGNWQDQVAPVAPKPVTYQPNAAQAKAYADTMPLEQVEALLKNPDTVGQLRADLQAAQAMHLNKMDYGPALPTPDPDKVAKAVKKLNDAAVTKGYPSKGYSQTAAIYKAQANGTIGSKVGVVKELTWEHKITAQAILDQHNAELPAVLRGIASEAKVAEAATKAEKDAWDALDVAAGSSDPHGYATSALDDMAEQAALKVLDALDAAKAQGKVTNTAVKAAQAQRSALLAVRQSYDDARNGLLALRDESATWTGKPGSVNTGTLTIRDDGWVVLDYGEAHGTQTLNPVQAGKILDETWEPAALAPNPGHVKGLVDDLLTADDGTLDAEGVQALESWLDDPTVGLQTKTDAAEALAQAKATLLPKPDPAKVAQYVDSLKAGHYTPADMQQVLDSAKTPGMKANLKAALEQYQADQSVVPNPAEVSNLIQMVEDGTLELSDLDPGPNWAAQTIADAQAAKAKILAQAKAPTPGAPTGQPFDLTRLKDTGQTLGTHGARVWRDPDTGERWLHKPQDDFLTELDQATARLQAQVGLKAPDTYVVTLGGRRGSIQRMFDAEDAWPHGFDPAALSEADLNAVTREHVLDWLLANHDGHHQQFLRLTDGTLTGIDKGQAFRWFGQDRLDWTFHPNAAYGAPPPVYNRLWADFAAGRDVNIDLATILDQAERIGAVSDDEIRALFRPYAEAAQRKGLLATPQPNYPGIVKGAHLPTNDVEAFLDAVVARKHALADDFRALYDRAAKARAKALPGWKPTKPKAAPRGKAALERKWKGKPQPAPPEPPSPPEAQSAQVFTSWLDKAKARYDASPAKKSATATLEQSNNWARFQKVMEQGDRTALRELLDRQYLDQDLYDEGLALIDRAEQVKAAAEAAHQSAVQAYEKARKAWQKDVQDWRDANGIVGHQVSGMDPAAKRHGTNPAGERWAQGHFDAKHYTATERQTLQSYTGSLYDTVNDHARRTEGRVTQHQAAYKAIDSAMAKQPIPEDVILHRGVGDNYNLPPFSLGGRRLGSSDDLTQIIGSVQVDWGYMSTSVGNTAAFDSKPIQLKIRTPAGTPAAYVQTFSHYNSERELILGRGQRFFIHNAYRNSSGKWIVECEIVPEDFDAAGAVPMPSSKPWEK